MVTEKQSNSRGDVETESCQRDITVEEFASASESPCHDEGSTLDGEHSARVLAC